MSILSSQGRIRAIVQFAVRQDRRDALPAIRTRIVQNAQQSVALTFDTFLSDDGSQFHLMFDAEDVNAVENLLLSIGPHLGELEAAAPLAKLQVFGDVPEYIRKSLAQFEPEFHSDWEGISR